MRKNSEYILEKSLEDEYYAVRNGIGLVHRSDSAFLLIEGKDSLDLLSRISTNDLTNFRDQEVLSTILVTEKAKIIDLATLIPFQGSYLMELHSADRRKIISWIERFIIIEDVKLTDVTINYMNYSILGKQVNSMLNHFGISMDNTLKDVVRKVMLNEIPVTMIQDSLFPAGVWNLYFPLHEQDKVENYLFSVGVRQLKRISGKTFETFRIEEGSPAIGKELTEQVNPLEAGLERYVSYTKGCYLGQEVIARLNTYKKLQRRLTRFVFDSKLEEGSLIFQEGNHVGWITSVCYSPLVKRWLGLGYLRTNIFDGNLNVQDQDGAKNKISVLKFPYNFNYSDTLKIA